MRVFIDTNILIDFVANREVNHQYCVKGGVNEKYYLCSRDTRAKVTLAHVMENNFLKNIWRYHRKTISLNAKYN